MSRGLWREIVREVPGLVGAVVLAVGTSLVLVWACAEVGVMLAVGRMR